MKITDDILACEERKFAAIKDCLTEKGRRLWSAAEAISYGRGGVFLVHKATNIGSFGFLVDHFMHKFQILVNRGIAAEKASLFSIFHNIAF